MVEQHNRGSAQYLKHWPGMESTVAKPTVQVRQYEGSWEQVAHGGLQADTEGLVAGGVREV